VFGWLPNCFHGKQFTSSPKGPGREKGGIKRPGISAPSPGSRGSGEVRALKAEESWALLDACWEGDRVGALHGTLGSTRLSVGSAQSSCELRGAEGNSLFDLGQADYNLIGAASRRKGIREGLPPEL
jgi:hypothetical protein